ncbi:hypothetical protein AGLY_001791 [Aphis glycines]|uniref:Uncharacterized protein n=1 Tax=Aphis glycines TaxID=307491 RepID=A0A6G0U744_APHGL|nr:hypothetical protein AGLY_001791 [Aphis glycines]
MIKLVIDIMIYNILFSNCLKFSVFKNNFINKNVKQTAPHLSCHFILINMVYNTSRKRASHSTSLIQRIDCHGIPLFFPKSSLRLILELPGGLQRGTFTNILSAANKVCSFFRCSISNGNLLRLTVSISKVVNVPPIISCVCCEVGILLPDILRFLMGKWPISSGSTSDLQSCNTSVLKHLKFNT